MLTEGLKCSSCTMKCLGRDQLGAVQRCEELRGDGSALQGSEVILSPVSPCSPAAAHAASETLLPDSSNLNMVKTLATFESSASKKKRNP